jgi:AcrR family transcriptional regulator
MPPDAARPPGTARSPRAAEVVAAARVLLEAEGPEALTMRAVAAAIGVKAPSLYKHLADKSALEAALVEEALLDMGAVLHAALVRPGRLRPVAALLRAYRREALEHPNLYRLATAGRLPRHALAPGVEDWAGEPFFLVTGEPHRAQALWSFAHGTVILEIDGRFPEGSDLDRTWRAGAAAFETAAPANRG